MKLNDLLGFDGFILEFFKVFWENFGEFVVRLINYVYDNNKLLSII